MHIARRLSTIRLGFCVYMRFSHAKTKGQLLTATRNELSRAIRQTQREKGEHTTNKPREPDTCTMCKSTPTTSASTNKKTEQRTLLGLVFIVEIRLLHLLDGVGNLALGGSDRHLLARAVAQQGLAKRRFVANLVLQRVGLNWAYHCVRLLQPSV